MRLLMALAFVFLANKVHAQQCLCSDTIGNQFLYTPTSAAYTTTGSTIRFIPQSTTSTYIIGSDCYDSVPSMQTQMQRNTQVIERYDANPRTVKYEVPKRNFSFINVGSKIIAADLESGTLFELDLITNNGVQGGLKWKRISQTISEANAPVIQLNPQSGY